VVTRPDCIIVGAGLVGLSAAFRLMRCGLRVEILAAGRPDASLAAAGMLAPGVEAAEAILTGGAHPRLAELFVAGAARWPAFAEELCGDSEDWRAIGHDKRDTLWAADGPDGRFVDALAKAAAGLGVTVEVLSGNEARRLEPALSLHATQALHFVGDSLIEPAHLIRALTQALRHAGIEIQDARIASVRHIDGVVRLRAISGATYEAGAVVLAAGWPGPHKLAPEFAHIIPIKGQIATLSARRPPRVMLRGPGIYLAPRGDGRVECGATSERWIQSLQTDPAAIQALQARAAALAPDLAIAWPIASRVGVRPGSPDQAPILGASAVGDRVFLAAAPHRNGILLAPLLADIIADGITGAESRGDWLNALSAARFSD